jgi:Fur family ferric uptake transcriptional regulator
MQRRKKKNPSRSKCSAELRIVNVLKSEGLKLTGQRLSLIAVLTKERGPLTMDELYLKALEQTSKSIDIATVYRATAAFEEVGLVNKCDFNDGCIRYELVREAHHHHHQCKRNETVEINPVKDFQEMPKKLGFHKVTHRLEFFGICQNCFTKS